MNQHGRGPLLAHGLTVDVVRGADVDGRALVDGAPGFVDEAGALVVAGGRTNTGIWTWIGGGPVVTVIGGGGGATVGGTVDGATVGGTVDGATAGGVVTADGGGPAGAAGMIGAAVLVDAPVPMVSAPTLASVVGV